MALPGKTFSRTVMTGLFPKSPPGSGFHEINNSRAGVSNNLVQRLGSVYYSRIFESFNEVQISLALARSFLKRNFLLSFLQYLRRGIEQNP